MRALFALLAAMAVTQCASREDRRFHIGQTESALVIIGVAEAARSAEPAYALLWRRLDPAVGGFGAFQRDAAFEARTNDGDTVRVRGIPGEFTLIQIPPGVYALDSVFATVSDRRVTYFANGLVEGPHRPSFSVGAGEAIYLGIWRAELNGANAGASLWRQERQDLRAVLNAANPVVGEVHIREIRDRIAPCNPQRMGSTTQRQIC